MFPNKTVLLKQSAHIGHGAIIHGATIGENVLVGMNAVIMDNADIGDESIIGALAFVKGEEKIPARSLVVGNPGKIVKTVSDEMIQWKTKGTKIYQGLPRDCFETLRETDPMPEVTNERLQKRIEVNYKPFRES